MSRKRGPRRKVGQARNQRQRRGGVSTPQGVTNEDLYARLRGFELKAEEDLIEKGAHEWDEDPLMRFQQGIIVGDQEASGDEDNLPVVDPQLQEDLDAGTAVLVTADKLNRELVPDDQAPPATPVGLTVTEGVKALFVKWTANTEVDMAFGYGTYQCQLATDVGFTSVVADVSTGASFASFVDLSTDITYYVRLKAHDAHGAESGWSSSASGTPVAIGSVDIEPGSITSDSIADFAVVAKKFNTTNHVLY